MFVIELSLMQTLLRDGRSDWLMKKKEEFLVLFCFFFNICRQFVNGDGMSTGVICWWCNLLSFPLRQTTRWLMSWWRRRMRTILDGGFLFEVHSNTRGCWSVIIVAGGPPTRMMQCQFPNPPN